MERLLDDLQSYNAGLHGLGSVICHSAESGVLYLSEDRVTAQALSDKVHLPLTAIDTLRHVALTHFQRRQLLLPGLGADSHQKHENRSTEADAEENVFKATMLARDQQELEPYGPHDSDEGEEIGGVFI